MPAYDIPYLNRRFLMALVQASPMLLRHIKSRYLSLRVLPLFKILNRESWNNRLPITLRLVVLSVTLLSTPKQGLRFLSTAPD